MNKRFTKHQFFIFIGLILGLLFFSTWKLDEQIELNHRSENKKILLNSMDSLVQALSEKKNEHLRHAKYVANSVELKELAKSYIQKRIDWKSVHRKAKPILMRQQEEHGYLGFFLISKDGLSLTSSRDSNVGSTNPLFKYKDIVDQMIKGESFITHPIISDVNLLTESHQLKTNYTMFIFTPVKEGEKILMYLAFRVSPEKFIWNYLEHEQIGDSGESYIVSADGKMLSPSRFQDQLHPHIQDYKPGMEILNLSLPIIKEGHSPRKELSQKLSGIRLTAYPDYRGTPVVGTWKWLDDYHVGLVIERDFEEAYKNHEAAEFMIWTIFAIVSLLIMVTSGFAFKSYEGMANVTTKMAKHLSNVDTTIISYDPQNEFQIHSINNHLPKLLGVKNEEIIGTSMLKWILQDDHEIFKKTVMHNMIYKTSFEQSFRMTDGKKNFWMAEKAQFQKHGSQYRIEGFLNDITEEKEMSKRLMKQITLSSVIQILLKHASGLKKDEELYTYILELLVNYNIAEIHSGSVYTIDEDESLHSVTSHGDNEDEIKGFISQWEDSNHLKTQILNSQALTESINEKKEELYLPIQEEGKVIAILKLNKSNHENFDNQEIQFLLSIVNIVSEILHRINVDEALIQERENKVKSERLLAAGEISNSLAHEINNPLMIIKGMTKLMQRSLEKKRFEGMAKKLKDLDKATDRISSLVSSLRLFNKNHTAKIEQFKFRPFFTSLMIEGSILAEKKDILLRYENSSDGCLLGDKEEVKFVLLKYISECCNIVKSQSQREILISTKVEKNKIKISIHNLHPPSSEEQMAHQNNDHMVETKIEGIDLWKNIVELNLGQVAHLDESPEHGFEISFIFEEDLKRKKSA